MSEALITRTRQARGVRDLSLSKAEIDPVNLAAFRRAVVAACPDITLWPVTRTVCVVTCLKPLTARRGRQSGDWTFDGILCPASPRRALASRYIGERSSTTGSCSWTSSRSSFHPQTARHHRPRRCLTVPEVTELGQPRSARVTPVEHARDGSGDRCEHRGGHRRNERAQR